MKHFGDKYIRLFGKDLWFNIGYNFSLFKVGIVISRYHIDIDLGFVWLSLTR